jgi:hypothetical protein
MDVNLNTSGEVISGHNWVGQLEYEGDYFIERSYLIFNTTTLPDDAVVTSGYITLVIYEDGSEVDFNVSLQQRRDPAPHYPMQPSDYYRNSFVGEYDTRNTTGYGDEDWFNFTLPVGAFTDIDATGHTFFGLRSDRDVDQIAPAVGTTEWIGFYGPGGVHPWKAPHLILNFTVPSSNWQYIVNLSFLSNSSGAWAEYYSCHVTGNGTVTVPNVNFSGNTTYYWNVSYESDNKNSGVSDVFVFETVNMSASGGVTILGGPQKRVMNYLAVGLFFGLVVGGMVFGMRRQRKRTGEQKTLTNNE